MRSWRRARRLFGELFMLLSGGLLLSGCIFFLMGEGFARIEGTVQDERGAPYRQCLLELLHAQDRSVLDHRRISATFAASFVIAPLPGSHLLRVSCAESDETFTSEPTSLSGYPAPLELGNIRLERRRRAE